jgi:hypothetical protein
MSTVINVTYSANNQEGANGFAELLREYVTHESFWFQVNEKMIQFGNGTMGSYWMGQASLVVAAESLNNCLVQADTVKHGFIPDAEKVLTHVFRDVRIEVVSESPEVGLVQQNLYLHNKVQELERAVGNLEGEVHTLVQLNEGYQKLFTTLQGRYEEHQAFLHDFIDFKNLIRVVRELAEKVDEEILDVYPLQLVH